jgi:rubrerythrin
MSTASPQQRREALLTEVDAAFLYGRIAANEEDEQVARLFREMATIERGHAEQAFSQLKIDGVLD